jgi:hypothetical protein
MAGSLIKAGRSITMATSGIMLCLLSTVTYLCMVCYTLTSQHGNYNGYRTVCAINVMYKNGCKPTREKN